jgi:CheY-like chemotaxis protein
MSLDYRPQDASPFRLDLLVKIKDTLNSKEFAALVLTASVAESDKERCLQLGARGYYVKPADLLGWTAIVSQIKESWIPVVTPPV